MREKLIDIIIHTPCVAVSSRTAAGHITDHLIQNGVTIQKWIPVTERVPEASGEYLTRCHHFRNGDWTEVVPFDAEKKYFVDLGKHHYPFVTHWMPLPEPPGEG